ncbi:CPBP family intramembrane metalloprotease [Bombilactobacillus folatiphilus]|uniref:CPBP family intramembrane metalloprotease n=1 Tax=Bombilactobacillus folatiphilus TaxID=2923362 RepID=A0ABY4PA83_9LACO|nr:type II CAAX endopeptidase family protein [Bombilactobacillus folatiphilus]UQS82653.1 CPBP family intramembrane metalloprotease [Bombilactobacillus folatiphilus]
MKFFEQNKNYFSTILKLVGLIIFYLIQQLPLLILQLVNKLHFSPMQSNIYFVIGVVLALSMMLVTLLKTQIFSTQKLNLKSYSYLLITFFITILINHLLLPLMKTSGNTNVNGLLKLAGSSPVFFLLYAVFIAPITEEILFRGFIINWFFPKHLAWGAFFSALLFGLIHVSQDPIYFLSKFLIGWLLGLLYLKTHNIKSNILLHLLNNLAAFFI